MGQPLTETKHIYIRNLDLGFWTQQPVTVQRYHKDEGLIWCDHAGAEEIAEEHEIINPNGRDIVYSVKVHICDKCGAWRRVGTEDWEDAPFEGLNVETDRKVPA